jgi:hypothetical protein
VGVVLPVSAAMMVGWELLNGERHALKRVTIQIQFQAVRVGGELRWEGKVAVPLEAKKHLLAWMRSLMLGGELAVL